MDTGERSRKAIVSLSGGMDSATVLALAVQMRGAENVLAASFWYGSKHNSFEIAAAMDLREHYKVKRKVFDVIPIFRDFHSALLDRDTKIPEGHYEEESMKQTIVPNRNLIFLSILAGYAVSEGYDEIWLGVHAGDHHIYFDCRPRFIYSAEYTIQLATDKNIKVQTPFLYKDKKGILEAGFELGVPYQHTRTCYGDKGISCGKCGSCVERLSAFNEIGKEDPLTYEDREFYKSFLKEKPK